MNVQDQQTEDGDSDQQKDCVRSHVNHRQWLEFLLPAIVSAITIEKDGR